MMTRIRHIILAALLVGSALPIVSAAAVPAQERAKDSVFSLQSDFNTRSETRHSGTRYAQQSAKRRISASRAKAIAMRSVRSARFINVQLVGGDTYRVRLQQENGRIVDVYVDAYTGRVRN